MKQLVLMFVILSGIISNHAFGDEYILHFEESLCDKSDIQITNEFPIVISGADEKKMKGQVVHETEILVQSGSRFVTKTVVGKTTTTVRGELKRMPEPGMFQLVFVREVTEASGRYLQTEDGSLIDLAPKTSFGIQRTVELGKPISMLKSEKGAWILSSIRLKPATNPN